jgi:hypothetical protein
MPTTVARLPNGTIKVVATRTTATPTPVPPPTTNVVERTPADVLAFLRGQLPGYPDGGPSAVIDFSPSDILETMDTIVLDEVRSGRGDAALQRIYDVIGNTVLATVEEEYGNQAVAVALDAGHGGKPGFFWDPGSEGTEAEHTRAVVKSILRQADSPRYANLIVHPIFNDAVADDFGLAGRWNRPTINQLLVRQARAAMLAQDTAAWNRDHPAAPRQFHEISVHFNAGAGGAMVLYQGDTVQPAFQARSLEFGQKYLRRVIADLNATGLLPTPLRRWGGSGLHDDVMMYRPDYLNGLNLPSNFTPRYAMLQGHGYFPRYISLLLANVS